MNFRVEQIAGQEHSLLRYVDGEVACAMATPLGSDDKSETAQVEIHRAVKAEIRLAQLFAFVGSVARIIGIFSFVELFQLLHLQVVDLILRRNPNWFVFAKMPGARG